MRAAVWFIALTALGARSASAADNCERKDLQNFKSLFARFSESLYKAPALQAAVALDGDASLFSINQALAGKPLVGELTFKRPLQMLFSLDGLVEYRLLLNESKAFEHIKSPAANSFNYYSSIESSELKFFKEILTALSQSETQSWQVFSKNFECLSVADRGHLVSGEFKNRASSKLFDRIELRFEASTALLESLQIRSVGDEKTTLSFSKYDLKTTRTIPEALSIPAGATVARWN